jgi:hypothetical protein
MRDSHAIATTFDQPPTEALRADAGRVDDCHLPGQPGLRTLGTAHAGAVRATLEVPVSRTDRRDRTTG